MTKFLKNVAVLGMVMLAAAVASCEKTPETPFTGQAVVSVNTASMYEELGIDQYVRKKLVPSGVYVITDTVLVYSQEGALIAKMGAESNTLGTQVLDLEGIPYGTYTVVYGNPCTIRKSNIRPGPWKGSPRFLP